ncbi:uncharacterized protein BT62DRAFT_1014126 [Guyanagaster necrorhizus]|uniref:Uncharacterized protein n=1 Tax=Guyanagaster necrorhizus TaxID=856835 RepID=A0A9P8ALY2_9AGAR|nr:uncharacterized protein BT62DRAFT_1014126 [Guyanagaster necrorhizus MCA 3950]KAG7439312.1 hypothetical protein BT62DRAFT_1014126 [Guyanagaster necrorhizus MCA 3950]
MPGRSSNNGAASLGLSSHSNICGTDKRPMSLRFQEGLDDFDDDELIMTTIRLVECFNVLAKSVETQVKLRRHQRQLFGKNISQSEIMSMLFICHGCRGLDLVREPVAICQCGEFWCTQLCLDVCFRIHFAEGPCLQHGFTDYYPRIDQEIVYQDPRRTRIRGLLFHQRSTPSSRSHFHRLKIKAKGSAPTEITLTFIFRNGTYGEIVDYMPQLDDFFSRDKLACRRVVERGDDPPFELWYPKNQMCLAMDPDSVNNTIVNLTGSREPTKLWYGPVVGLILEKDTYQKKFLEVTMTTFFLQRQHNIFKYRMPTDEEDVDATKCHSHIPPSRSREREERNVGMPLFPNAKLFVSKLMSRSGACGVTQWSWERFQSRVPPHTTSIPMSSIVILSRCPDERRSFYEREFVPPKEQRSQPVEQEFVVTNGEDDDQLFFSFEKLAHT